MACPVNEFIEQEIHCCPGSKSRSEIGQEEIFKTKIEGRLSEENKARNHLHRKEDRIKVPITVVCNKVLSKVTVDDPY